MKRSWAALDALAVNSTLITQLGEIVDVNDSWRKFAQSNDGDINDWSGVNYLSVCDAVTGVDAEDARTVSVGIRSVLNGDATEFSYMYPCHSPSEKRWYRVRVTPWTQPDGKVLITHEDLTAIKIAEEALKASIRELEVAESGIRVREHFIRSVTDSFPDMIGYWDKNLRCCFANSAYLAWFNKTPSTLLGISLQELLGEVLFSKNKPYIEAVLTGVSQEFERTLVRADGTVGFTLAKYISDKDSQGNVVGFFVLVSDISPVKNAQSELKLAAAVFQNVSEAIMVTNGDGIILSVNPAFTEITGYSSQEAVGQTSRLLQSYRHEHHFHVEVWKKIELAGRWQGEIWNRRKNGDVFLASQTITRIPSADGESGRYVSVFHDVTDVWSKNEEIKRQAFHDALTGLPNRSLLIERIEHQIAMNARELRPLSVLFLDLDHFKAVNDELGHAIGDELLIAVSRKLSSLVRQSDTVARLGGDEFVILLDSPENRDEVAQIAQRIIEVINEPLEFSGKTAHVGTSIGVAVYPTDGRVASELLKSADTAMYRAKKSGRNLCRFFADETPEYE